MSTGIIMNFRFMHNQGGRLYKHRVTGQVLWLPLCSPKGLMPSALRPNHTFLASSGNSFPRLSFDFSPLRPISEYSQLSVFLTVFSVPSHRLGILFVLEQTFQPWYYRSIPHHLGRNLLPGALALDITRVITADLIAQCTTYRASVQILVLTAVEDAIIRACMYLLHL